MNFCPGSKNSINGKNARYDRIINELCIKCRTIIQHHQIILKYLNFEPILRKTTKKPQKKPIIFGTIIFLDHLHNNYI
jgi:hypothetical protein